MNWFSKSFVAWASKEQKRELVNTWGGCEHVTKDPLVLHTVSYENDSFGREGYCLCTDCVRKLQEEDDKRAVVCDDCFGVFEKQHTTLWRAYDFCAADGDQPVTVCQDCVHKEKHARRVEADAEDAYFEAQRR